MYVVRYSFVMAQQVLSLAKQTDRPAIKAAAAAVSYLKHVQCTYIQGGRVQDPNLTRNNT